MPTPVPGLADKVDEVIEAAINAEMNESGWYGSCEDGFHVTARATETDPMPPEIVVSYPGGEVLAYGEYPDDSMTPVIDVHEVYARWRRNIEQVFDPWAELPDPDAFEPHVERLRGIASGLAPGGAATVGQGAQVEVGVGNLDLHSYVTDIVGEVGGCEGDAFEALYDSYLGRLAPVLNGQAALAVVLGTTLAGEQELWKRARTDIVDLAEHARAAFQAVADDGGGRGLGFVLSLLGVALSAAGIFASGGVAVAVGLVSTANSLATLLIPPPAETPRLELGGSSTHEVYTNLLVSASDTVSAVQQEEQSLYLAILDVCDIVEGSMDYYDFGTPSDFLAENRPGQLFDAAENVRLVKEKVLEAAAKLEAVSGILTQIDGDLVTTGTGPWERDGMLGHLGYVGFYRQWNNLLELLSSLADRSARAMDDVAGRMVLVAHDFQVTDEQIDQELSLLVLGLDDPTPTTDVPFGHP